MGNIAGFWFGLHLSVTKPETLLDGMAPVPTSKIESGRKKRFAIANSVFGISARQLPIGIGRRDRITDLLCP